MLDASMLAAMRDAIEELLPDTCTILSVTRTPDSKGGWTEAWGTASSSVACRLDMKSGVEQLQGGGVEPYKSYALSLPYDTTITTEYRVVHSGTTYNVKTVNTNQSWIAVRRVELEVT
jgi:head-tail adaptor